MVYTSSYKLNEGVNEMSSTTELKLNLVLVGLIALTVLVIVL